jgi:hypothetical protein
MSTGKNVLMHIEMFHMYIINSITLLEIIKNKIIMQEKLQAYKKSFIRNFESKFKSTKGKLIFKPYNIQIHIIQKA